MGHKGRGGALAALVLGVGCSTGSSSVPASRVGDGKVSPPIIADVTPFDGDANHIDDRIDTDLRAFADDGVVAIEAMFRAPMPASATTEFEAAGGTLRRVLRRVGYGFTGHISRSAIAALVPKLGPDLLLVKEERRVELHLDESTRTSRARAVWANGFAGSAAGFNGSNKVNIAIIDSGVDATHPDLAGREIGHKDFTLDADPDAKDVMGHGTHIAGIALGSGVAFSAGGGTLSVTETGNASDPDDPLDADDYYPFPYHLPPSFKISGAATFDGSATTISFLRANDGSLSYTELAETASLASPLAFDFDGTAAQGTHFTLGLRQNASKDVGHFAIAAKITNVPAASDGFPVMRGVAPLSGYYAAKVFPSFGNADTGDITDALEEIDEIHESLDIKVINCSFGAADTSLRAKVATLASHGIVVVASSGNSAASGGVTLSPGSAAAALTVGATSDVNLVTRYSSGRAKGAGETNTDDKPDLVAPGGSVYRSKVLAADSNVSDSEGPSPMPDVQANDYTSMMGTSMAAPVVAGAAALVIQALESKGHVWDYASNKSAFLVKMLLLATATETNLPRETDFANPSLGRAGAPKDITEGFGIVNIDAAIEAATTTWDLATPITASTTGSPSDRRAWARKVRVPAGHTLKLALDAPETGDFDVHVYKSAPSASGTPELQAWSARDGLGVDEVTTWTFFEETELYVVVKRIDGSGSFTLTGATFTCGNGTREPGEECDDGNRTNGDCCNAGCQLEGTPVCPDLPDAGPGDDEDAGVDAGPDDEDASPPPPPPPPGPTATANPPPAPDASTVKPAPEPEPTDSGGCSTSGASASFGSLGLAVACGLVLRRRRRS